VPEQTDEEKMMADTRQNLKTAFAGESQANRKYLAFAKQADKEGYPQAAKLFRAAAEAETIHAHNHLRLMGVVGNTAENLQAAINGETEEFEQMYPEFIAQAKAEGNSAAERSFTWANEVEKIHAQLYRQALSQLDNLAEEDYYICQGCGNTVAGTPPDKCPICGAPREKFTRIE
jgi:rubrerythrin